MRFQRGEFTVLRTAAAQVLVCMLVMMQCIVIRREKVSPIFKKDFGGQLWSLEAPRVS